MSLKASRCVGVDEDTLEAARLSFDLYSFSFFLPQIMNFLLLPRAHF